MSTPRWQLCPAWARKPDRGKMTPTFSVAAWARTMLNGAVDATSAPAAPAIMWRRVTGLAIRIGIEASL
jgi:hypothetical protein